MSKNKIYLNTLLFLVMMYMAIDLTSMVFAYKIFEFNGITAMTSSIVFPLTYSLMDIIAEIYGYDTAKNIIFYSLICDLFFTLLVSSISHIPSPTLANTSAYLIVLGLLPRALLAQAAGMLTGSIINVAVISKLKSMTNGKYFWLRSISSSIIGEAVMLMISIAIALSGIIALSKIFNIVLLTFLYKVAFAVCIAPVISFFTAYIKIKIQDVSVKSNLDFKINVPI